MENGHKSFICYRKKPSDNEVHRHHPTLQWSENVAGLLSYMINNESEFLSVAPALFQESTSPTDLILWNDTPEGIVKNVSAISYFYVALCPDFFDPIIREYHEELKTSPETAVENIIKRLSSSEKPIHVPIACIELLYAMVSTNIQICPYT